MREGVGCREEGGGAGRAVMEGVREVRGDSMYIDSMEMVHGIFLEKQDAKSSPTNPTRRSSRGGWVRKFLSFFKEFYFAGGESNPRPFRLLFHPLAPSQSRLTTSGPLIGRGGDCVRAGSCISSAGGGAGRRETDRGVVGGRKVWH